MSPYTSSYLKTSFEGSGAKMDERTRTGMRMQGYGPAIMSTGILGPQSAEVQSGMYNQTAIEQHPASSSPLFLLHQMMATAGVDSNPQFDFAEVGHNQERLYQCTAKVLYGNEVIQGSGQAYTKRDAKNRAASQVLQALKGRNIGGGGNNMSRRRFPPKERKVDSDAVRSPISMLTEYCNRSRLLPTFSFTEIGPIHQQKFECQVLVLNPADPQGSSVKGNGEGRTKKDAKHDAARNLLKHFCPEISDKLDSWFAKVEAAPKRENSDLEQVPGNPLGELNEMCMKTKKVIPEYIEEEPEGSPHERIFTTICKIGSDLVEKGQGSSKKNAKRVAAYKMLQKIKSMPETSELDKTVEGKLRQLSLSSKAPKERLSPAEIIKNFNSRQGNILDMVRNTDRSGQINDPVKVLSEVADEQKLFVDWIELQDPVNAEKFQLLFLGPNSETSLVFSGKGENRNKCRRNAALNALQFMRSTSSL